MIRPKPKYVQIGHNKFFAVEPERYVPWFPIILTVGVLFKILGVL